ncbi:MAG: Acg family FMN-binding oxidoreductase [Marmoricola sp.]
MSRSENPSCISGEETMRRIVELACRAPSVHNTQPWVWRISGNVLELRADRARQLDVSDPDGRNLTISCGAALHHALVAARALGWTATVDRMPDARDPDFFAQIRIIGARTRTEASADDLRAIADRCTDRRRFTSWPVPEERLHQLAAAARHWGADVLPVSDVTLRLRVELLLSRAMLAQTHDRDLSAEEQLWIDHSSRDGIPARTIPRSVGERGERPSRFDKGVTTAGDVNTLESSDGLLVIGTTHDGPLSWLRAGESLSALWLRATAEGMSVVPLSQVTEVESTRVALQHEVLSGALEPQLLVRIGWQEIGRSDLPRTPRRPLAEVLRR